MKRLLATAVFSVILYFAALSQCSNLRLSVDKKIQCAPGIINFNVSGAPTGSSYLWDFGNGYTVNTDTVYEFFLNAQVIDVKVQVTFPNGFKCTVQEIGIAEILAKPIASYTISRRKLCDGPDTVTLINTTPNTQEISWIVDGTNYFSAPDTITHKFKTSGDKNINIVVTDSFGCRNVQEFTNVAVVHPDVIVNFTADHTDGCVTKNVQFTANIRNNGQKITSSEWQFKGANIGFSGNLTPPQLRYVNPGEYGASLTVKTDKGCTHSLTKEKYLKFGDSIQLELSIKDQVMCVSDSTSVHIINPVAGRYYWNIEGTPDTTMNSATDLTVKFNQAGEFDVHVVLNFGGCFSLLSVKDAIKVKDVKANFKSPDNYHCKIPHITHIKNTSTSYNNTGLTYQWNISDIFNNAISTSNKKNLNYASPDWGRYSVELIAMDQFGCTDTMFANQFIRVDSIRPAIARDERVGCVNQTITLRTSTPESSYQSSDSFYWIIYDLDGKTIYNQGNGREIKQSFSKPGFYDVKLYAGNLIGCIDSLNAKEFIEIIKPVKGFKVNTPMICAYDEVELQATTTPESAPFKHTWEITHQSTGTSLLMETDTAKVRSILLSRLGKYNVMYHHQINDGCKDSLQKNAAIHVNGLTGEIKLSKSSGCVPMETTSSFNVVNNFHFGNNSDSISYSWSVAPKEGVEISDPKAANPTIKFTKQGVYTVYIHAENSSSCGFNSRSQQVFVGVIADFEVDKNKVCAGQDISITNTSQLAPFKYQWNIFSSGAYAIDPTVSPVIFTPNGDTYYDIQLVASKEDACFDTITKRVHSLIVTSDFEMADTHLFCAPAYAQFNTLSENADTFYWNFGDGSEIASTDTYIANIYNRNTGSGKGFDVTLISKSYLGCADTLTIESAVKIFGPVPDFTITNPIGCEPLEVTFTNKSRDVVQYFLNFDDNTNLDSTDFNSHTYVVQTTNLNQKFIPSVYALDSLGCATVYVSQDTITVLKRPKAIPSDQEIEGCSPVQVALNDESLRITSRSWLLNRTEISRETSINPSISEPGNHVIELIVSNSNNCSDTSTFNVAVYENPKATFTLTQIPCLNEFIEATGQSTRGSAISDWVWVIKNLAIVDTTHTPNYPLLFNQSGNYRLEMKAINTHGCFDEYDSTFIIRGVDDIPQGEIDYVTVNEEDHIEIHWTDINPDFISQTTVRDHETQQVLYQNGVNRESMVTVLYNDLKQAHCFTISHTNFCGDLGIESSSHCPIILNVEKAGNYELNLNWSLYTGWNSVNEYIIYRSADGKNFEELTRVDGSIQSYTDKLLCDQQYCYIIEASNGQFTSRSNKDENTPIYINYMVPVDITYATIEDNSIVGVYWNAPTSNYPFTYRLNQYDAYGINLIESTDMENTRFYDDNIDVTSENYVYKVQIVNHCGLAGMEGYQGKPILLQGHYIDDAGRLNWSAYEEWDEGVDYYDIQIEKNQQFVSIATVPGNQNAYVDKEFHKDINGDYVYRVIAVSYNSEVTSMSNQIDVRGASYVWVPNAFSPNDDNHNPNFKPSVQFMYLVNNGTYRDYEMKIYNRWGEELFRTNEVTLGWDGTYKQKDCEMESYLYHIRVTGLDRVIYDKKGLVRLMR